MIKRVLSLLLASCLVFTPLSFAVSTATTLDTDTKIMLHMDGADASTTFTDSSASGKTVTANGDAQLDTAQKKFGTASGLFDGSGDYLSTTSTLSDFSLGTGDFTIDFWFMFDAAATVSADFFAIDDFTDTSIYVRPGDGGTFGILIAGGFMTFTQAINKGQWYHLALTRSGTAAYCFLDGVQKATATLGGSVSCDTVFKIGLVTDAFKGWMDEFRFVKGTCVWTGGTNGTTYFTPPTAAYTAPNNRRIILIS